MEKTYSLSIDLADGAEQVGEMNEILLNFKTENCTGTLGWYEKIGGTDQTCEMKM